MAPQCQALNVSDERRCTEAGTNANGLFCSFHARQAYSMYKGYKRRGAQLDAMSKKPPSYLAEDRPLHAVSFNDINDHETLVTIHEYLFKQHSLLDRVIRARKLHHSRFYALKLDYGHQSYLDYLQSRKHDVGRALERVWRRTAECLYEQKAWFQWVRHLEDDEEKERDAEKKKIKHEAALFKRHWAEVQARQTRLKQRENEKRQAEYLDKAWEERHNLDVGATDEDYDPIEDIVEDERGSYLDLIRRFLWLEAPVASVPPSESESSAGTATSSTTKESAPSQSTEPISSQPEEPPKSKNAKKKARQKAKAAEAQEASKPKLGEVHIETPEEVRNRLKHGSNIEGGWFKTFDPNDWTKSTLTPAKTSPLKDDEIESLLQQIPEIKQLLFCRLLLSHATLLPAALRANSVEELLTNTDVTNADLRDLCLKMEQPGLQELRDACADLGRDGEEDEEGDGNDTVVAKTEALPSQTKMISKPMFPPKSIKTKREKALKERRDRSMPTLNDPTTFVDFGDYDDSEQYRIKKIKVKVCGKWIYNYPSEKAMTRGGWLQFSVIAKDCSLFDAVVLARSWDEFFELNILTLNHYFPAGNWVSWMKNPLQEQLLQVGFIPYFQMDKAEDMTSHHQTGSRAYGQRRTHRSLESRNFVCAHMKRNDPVTRRFIQYCVMEASKIAVIVRDVKTGNIIVQPPKEHLWLIRRKSGLGRASKSEWETVKEIDDDFWDEIDRFRQWHLGFKDYYDFIVWDLQAGEQFISLYNTIQSLLIRALRFKDPKDFYNPAEHVLRTITRDDPIGHDRVRDLRPEEVGKGKSIWDNLQREDTRMVYYETDMEGNRREAVTPVWLYTQDDALEDQVLFPWDRTLWIKDGDDELKLENDSARITSLEIARANANRELIDSNGSDEAVLTSQTGQLHAFEHHGLDLERWVRDLDTDEEPSDEEDIEEHTDDGDDGSEWESDEEYNEGFVDALTEATGVMIKGRWLDEHDEREPAWDLMNFSHNIWEASDEILRQGYEPPIHISATDPDSMDEQWEILIDRTRASSFKEAWHAADLENGAQEKYKETRQIMDAFLAFFAKGTKSAFAPSLMALQFKYMCKIGIHPDAHRRIKRDMTHANALTTWFFEKDMTFFESEEGLPWKNSHLFDQVERASSPPDCRSSVSNKFRPASQFEEWDKISEAVKTSGQGRFYWAAEKYPRQWKPYTRPAIALLYRNGLLAPRYDLAYTGVAISLTEPDRPNKPDLYFDFRNGDQPMKPRFAMVDPMKVDPLLSTAKEYAAKHPDAKFSYLRIWSAPHFWPLMVGYENRDGTSFTDDLGRVWEWKFVPKDSPYSEWSIHHGVRMRLDPFGDFFKKNVVFKCDKVVVMAEDHEQCRMFTTMAVFALTTRPWRLEVDAWKSFFGVEIGFLEGLHQRWWDA